MYIYENKDWPNFIWNESKLIDSLAEVRYLQGRLLGYMGNLGFKFAEEATFQTLTQDIIKTSEIEGEKLDTEQVRSSLAKKLGLETAAVSISDRHVEGIVNMMLDATQNYQSPLTSQRLFNWHTALFPVTEGLIQRIRVGKWRTQDSGPMQIVSGPYGREKIHYEAPSYDQLEKEMSGFINWFNEPAKTDLIIKSACAHFWFVSIHPFDDGNGRIARAIADSVLARSENNQQRFYSMSAQIQKERKAYYEVLERCQKGTLDITLWIEWFLNCLKNAIYTSENTLKNILRKAQFWGKYIDQSFNVRQRTVLNRLFNNFEGKLTSSKWSKLGKCSKDTALRDINNLIERNILKKENSGGRSTSYVINIEITKNSV